MKYRSSTALVSLVTALSTISGSLAAEPRLPIRAGMIGLDTSHAVAFTKLLRDPKASDELRKLRIVAAYPGGSPDIPSSRDRVKEFTQQMRGMGVEIVDSIDELLHRVDVVLVMSIDGRTHLAQARPVIAAGKPLFIDKPMAASLDDATEIFRLARERHVPCFSSSALQFSSGFQSLRQKRSPLGNVRGCVAWSPLHLEPHHPDLFWYGIHGVETLYTIMGSGCKSVTRPAADKVVGVWTDGRTGTFVAKNEYGAQVEGTRASGSAGRFEGYAPLVVEIARFFKTGRPPVAAEETLEILAFMEAADESKRLGGAPVQIETIMARAAQRCAEPRRPPIFMSPPAATTPTRARPGNRWPRCAEQGTRSAPEGQRPVDAGSDRVHRRWNISLDGTADARTTGQRHGRDADHLSSGPRGAPDIQRRTPALRMAG